MKKYSHIFFDLDGTLTQSEFGIIRSAKHAITAKKIIDHYGLDDRFSAVIGPDKSEKSPDKKMLIERAIAENNIDDKASVIMVGDRLYDIEVWFRNVCDI